ncbi:MAG: aldo/keto reductase [Muribaculaceae bacterium]|nr:aldo/keto reductase [Muribaculaceae bacterium]
MEFVDLKNSGLRVSRLCMGGCPMGGYGWGDVQEKELLDAIDVAIENGINFFDTADTYGLGQSEITLAKGLGERRKDVVIETKFGVRFSNSGTIYDNSPSYIRESLENSLKRLKTDYIDIYTIHYRDYSTPIESVVNTLESLKEEGKIRFFGLSNISLEGLTELLPYRDKFVCCQDEFSLACRKHENELIDVENSLNVTPMTWGSLGQGVLTGKYNRDCSFGKDDRRSRNIYVNFHGNKLKHNLEIVEAMRPIASAHNVSVAAVAIRFILDYLKDSVVLVGAKRPSQIESNLESIDWHLSEKEIELLNSISLSDVNV